MEERQVTVDGQTHQLPKPFFVIATQNPAYQIGTFPLPESQLDRFMMRIELGYPNRQAERELLLGKPRHELIQKLPVYLPPVKLAEIQQLVSNVYVAPALLDYLQAIIDFTRQSNHYPCGLSPRAGLGLLTAAKAWAFVDQRNSVVPEDLQAVLPAVVGHRLAPNCQDSAATVAPILKNVAIH
jgi:MoxR-like ATPase